METLSNQERRRDFDFYMSLDREKSRCFIENKCVSLTHSMFYEAQMLEMLKRKLQGDPQ